ncbi:MAG TPA: hypothetical protein VLA34_00675, partial [Candidatus Krumholzibacterium sp.]|nr:hypothetical protein [Candidatus Krumholzibacterium sp.]
MRRRASAEVSIPGTLFLCMLLAAVLALPGIATAQVQVKDHNEINSVYGLPGLPVDLGNYFGTSMTQLGDLDGDGISELVAGAGEDVWIMFPDSRGLVKSYTRINSTSGGFTGLLEAGDAFGWSVEGIGDLDDDGIADLAVGAYADDDGGDARGAVYILFLNADGTVKSHQKISSTQGGFTGILDNSDFFGISLGELGDLDGDGVEDLAVGAYADDDGGSGRGAVWILFLNTNGTVKAHQKISDTAGNFTGTLDNTDYFGSSVTNLGDIDGDTVIDIAVGAKYDDDGASGAGAVWILFMNSDGTVKAHQKISRLEGNFSFVLEASQSFGEDLASPGDIDGDGTNDLVVGAPNQHSTYSYNYQGMVFSLLLNTDGTVKAYAKIDRTSFAGGNLNAYGYFGYGITAAGDVDGDGIGDLAVGAYRDNDCGSNVGSVYILPLASDGSLKSYYNNKINCTMGGLIGMMFDYEYFGSSVAGIGDIDGNGVGDMVVGATGDKERYFSPEGSIWLLLLDSLGTVEDYTKISAATGWAGAYLDSNSEFGCAVDSVGDLDGDGYTDLVVGASNDYDGAAEAGAVWILFLDSDHTVKAHQKISATYGAFAGILISGGHFGSAVAGLGDLDGDGVEDIVVGSDGDNGNSGCLWVLFLNTNGKVKSHQKIGQGTGGFTGTLDTYDGFGSAVVNAGDIDGDGVTDLAVGAPGDDDAGASRGSVWLLFMNTDGTVKSNQKISALEGGFPSAELDDYDELGSSLAALGDLDGNGTPDLAAGVPFDDEGGTNKGAFWTLFLDSDGTVASHAKIGDYSGNFGGILYSNESFGSALAFLGDLNGDGFGDIAVGAPLDDNYEYSYHARGSVWTLRLEQEPASCAVSPASIDFGIVDYGTYVDTTFSIENTGGVILAGTISESCDDFSIVSGGGSYSIGPDSIHVVTVRYEPSTRGVHGC